MIISTNTTSDLINMVRDRRVAEMNQAFERISSGRRINRSADDPSGMAISSHMKAMIRGQGVAAENIQDGIALMRVQDGGLQEISRILQRMRDIAVRSANDVTLTQSDQEKLDNEFKALREDVNQIAHNTTYNEIQVLLGTPVSTTTDLEFEVEWWTPDTDLDMHVIQPDGAHAWWSDLDPNGHGEIDIDDLDGSSGPADPAVEHYNVASGAALAGNYELWINYYGENGFIPAPPLPDVVATVTVSMYRGTPSENITTFNVTCTYQPGDAPFMGAGGPYGEVFVGTYNWQPLGVSNRATLQIGENNAAVYQYDHDYFDSQPSTLMIAVASISTGASARAAIDTIDLGIENVNNYLQTIGVRERDITHALNGLKTSSINLMAANSRIEDADMAVEITNLTRSRIMDQAAISAAIYSNTMSKDFMTLLGTIT